MTDQTPALNSSEDMTLLIVDDDKPFQQRLARAMEKRGFTTETADSVQDAAGKIAQNAPAFAIVDMRLEDGNGLDVIEQLRQRRPDARATVLTDTATLPLRSRRSNWGPSTISQSPPIRTISLQRLRASPKTRRSRRKIRCRPTGSAGSISSGCTSFATATFRRPHAG